jgi:large-conductance mechanosensitive channel
MRKNKNTFNMVVSHFADWLHANWLILNVDRMNIVKFTQSNVSCNPLTIVYGSKLLTKVVNFKFICPIIDKHLSWSSHINKLLSKLSTVYYTIRKLSSVLNILRIVYFANFKSFLDWHNILGKFFSCWSYIFSSKKNN